MMDPGPQREVARHDEADEADGGTAADAGLAPDDVTSAYEDERVRRVIDGLLHPGTTAPGSPVAPATRDPSMSEGRPGPAQYAVGELGLCRSDTWHRLLEAEHARVARYGTRTTVVQLEIADIGLLATLLGEEAATRLVGVLANAVREDSRHADTYARIGHWRIAGLLPNTDGRTADHAIRRIQEGFRRRLADRLPVGLMAGRAEVNPDLNPAATMARAEGSMHLEGHGPTEPGRRPGSAGVRAIAGSDTGTDDEGLGAAGVGSPVSDRLRVLAQLHTDGLVTDDEYRTMRLEILRRI